MSFDAWIVIMLAGIGIMVALLAIMLTLLAIGIAIAAWWGYGGMMEEARKQAAISAKQISLKHLISRATDAAKQQAEATILANKDKWLEEMALGLELSAAQSEPSRPASNNDQTVGNAWPGERGSTDGIANNDNTRTDNPAPPTEASS
jgi:hypothetical protein